MHIVEKKHSTNLLHDYWFSCNEQLTAFDRGESGKQRQVANQIPNPKPISAARDVCRIFKTLLKRRSLI